MQRWVTFSEDAKQNIRQLETEISRLSEVLQGVHIFLEVSAHNGKLVHPPLYLYVTSKLPQVPALEFYYTFDSGSVTVHEICIAEDI